jgi:hypothetical protein
MERIGLRTACAVLLVAAGALLHPQQRISAQVAVVGASAAEPPCPTTVQMLVPASSDPGGRSPAQQLKDLLYPGAFAGTIAIPSRMTVEMGEARGIPIGRCVTIKSTRNGLDRGALITATNRDIGGAVFFVFGQRVRIEGLRFRGPVTTDDRSPQEAIVKGVAVLESATATIDNNVFEFWSTAVVVERPVLPPLSCRDMAPVVTITRNYFNRNTVEDDGYGVGLYAGCATIEGNLFNKNRHTVAASGATENGKGYIARFNYVLEGGFTVCEWWGCYWNQHFDVHGTGSGGYGGTAGEYFDISRNTIRGEQTYGLLTTRPAFMLRGKPTLGAFFNDNVVVHDDAGEAVRLKAGSECIVVNGGVPQPSPELCNLHVGPNRYNTDMINETAVGDFDGDGRDDVFLANGTAWWYSSAGVTEWRFLRASPLRVTDLRFGKFNHDQRTDVLLSAGGSWYVSYGGTTSPAWIRTDGTSLLDCVFGDFSGDGITDALRANGATWSIASNATAPWIPRLAYPVRAGNLRVSDFTGDRVDDVFWIESNTWHLWDPARNVVTADHRMPVVGSDMPLLVVADFDGDGRADLAKTEGDGWIWLQTGTQTWAQLRGAGGQSGYKEIRAALIGRFTAFDRRADAIRYASSSFPDQSKFGFAIWNGSQDAFVAWTPAWQEMR